MYVLHRETVVVWAENSALELPPKSWKVNARLRGRIIPHEAKTDGGMDRHRPKNNVSHTEKIGGRKIDASERFSLELILIPL